MLKAWRYLWISTTVLLSLLLLLLIVVTQLDPNLYKKTIESQVSELTGRQLKIDGDLQIDFTLHPLVRIEKLSFANAPWGKLPQMLSLDMLQLKISLLPLLENKLVIEQLLLEGVYVSIETNTDDQINWLLEKLASEEPEIVEEPDDTEPFELPILPIIKQLQFDRIHIYYHDAIAELETDALIDKLHLDNQGNDKAITFFADGVINENPFNFSGKSTLLKTATTKNLLEQGVSLQLDADALGLTLTVDGKIERPTIAEGVNINLSLDADDLDKSFTAATGQSIYHYLRKGKQPIAFNVSTNFRDIEHGYTLSDIQIDLADNDLNGELSFLDTERPEIAAKFHSDNINLDHLLAEKGVEDTKDEVKILVSETVEEQTNKIREDKLTIDLPESHLPFDILKAFDAKLEYSIDQFKFENIEPQSINLNASMYNGLLQVKQFDLNLEGAPIHSSLTIDGHSKTPRISTTLDIDSLSLDLISKRLQVEQLKLGTLRSKIKLDTEGNNIKSLILNLNGNTDIWLGDNDIAGKFSFIDNPERPKIIADFHSENIDLSKLIPDRQHQDTSAKNANHIKEDNKAKTDKALPNKNRSDKAFVALPEAALPFGLLKVLDTDLVISIRKFKFDTLVTQNIKLDASLNDGLLQVKQFDFNFNEETIRSSIEVDGNKRNPHFNVKLDVNEFELNNLPQQLQSIKFNSGVFNTNTDLHTSGNNVKALVMNLGGRANLAITDTNFNHHLKGKEHHVYVNKLQLEFSGIDEPFSYDVIGTIDDKPISLDGYLDSPAAVLRKKNFRVKLDLDALNLNLDVEGSIVNPEDIGSAELDIALVIPSVRTTKREIAQFIPRIKSIEQTADIPVSVHGKLISSPNTYRVNSLQISAGKNDLSGNIFADLRGRKPLIIADLHSKLLDMNEVLPGTKLEESDTTQATEAQSTHPTDKSKPVKAKLFSETPFPNLDILDKFDINFKLVQEKLLSNEQAIDNIRLDLTLKDGILNLDPISIDFSNGNIRSKLVLSQTDKTRISHEGNITKLDYGNLMTILGMKQYAKGELDAYIKLAGEGVSVSEFMASLNGQIRVTTVDGLLDKDSQTFLSKDVGSLIPFTDTSNRQKINCGVVQFNIKDGLASTHSMVVNTGAISALGTGDINLANETYSLYVAPRTKRTSVIDIAMVPVNITGPLSSPSIKPDVTGSTISTTKTYANISLTVATGGLWLLAEGMTNKLWDEFIDDTDYCARALAGDKIVPRRIKLEEEAEKKIKDDDLSDIFDDDESDLM